MKSSWFVPGLGPQENATFVKVLRHSLSTITSEKISVRDVRQRDIIRIESRGPGMWLRRQWMRCDIHASNELGGMVVRVERSDGLGSRGCIITLMPLLFACVVSGVFGGAAITIHRLGLSEWVLVLSGLSVVNFVFAPFYIIFYALWSHESVEQYNKNIGIFRDAAFGHINQAMVEMRIPESIIQRGGEALKKD